MPPSIEALTAVIEEREKCRKELREADQQALQIAFAAQQEAIRIANQTANNNTATYLSAAAIALSIVMPFVARLF
jgi:uncharacterized membrane protein